MAKNLMRGEKNLPHMPEWKIRNSQEDLACSEYVGGDLMKQEKVKQIAEAMSGLSYREFEEVASVIEASYHITKKELTSKEISSAIKNVH